MSRAQSPVRAQSPSYTTDELLVRVLSQMETLTISFNALKNENENRIDEISRLSKKLGGAGTVETDSEFQQRPEATDDHSSVEEKTFQRKETFRPRQENIYGQSQFFPTTVPTAPHEERKMGAKLAIETIKPINGQDDMGVEDFIKTVKRARIRCEEPEILLDLILAKKITHVAEKAIRYMQINSYEDLYAALRQNLRQTSSLISLKSKLESCKQGLTETVQNFTTRFRQITNEINYLVQSQHVNPTKRRLKIELEEEEAVNRYLLNLKREIGMQVRLLKPNTVNEAQALAIETETWLKDSQPVRQIIKPPVKIWAKSPGPPRLSANTTPRAQNSTIPLSDRFKMNCFKCGKIGHISSQCQVKQGFPPGHGFKRPPPVRAIQEEETEAENMTEEEITEQLIFEESAEFLPYAEDYEQSMPEEKLEDTDY